MFSGLFFCCFHQWRRAFRFQKKVNVSKIHPQLTGNVFNQFIVSCWENFGRRLSDLMWIRCILEVRSRRVWVLLCAWAMPALVFVTKVTERKENRTQVGFVIVGNCLILIAGLQQSSRLVGAWGTGVWNGSWLPSFLRWPTHSNLREDRLRKGKNTPPPHLHQPPFSAQRWFWGAKPISHRWDIELACG